EDPHIPHFGRPNKGVRLKEGMVITIEPMINEGSWKSQMDANNWTARTIDKGRSAQYEHTIVITNDEPLILTEQDKSTAPPPSCLRKARGGFLNIGKILSVRFYLL